MKEEMDGVEQKHKLLRQEELAFFGVVTASLSHEINNAVAIIGQLAGLLEDLLWGVRQGKPIDDGKLEDVSEKISNQVKKGQSVIKRLNRFAHSVDEPVKEFDLREMLEFISVIAERFAFLKGAKLELASQKESLTVTSNPFSLQQAVFICIEMALSASGKNEVVKVACEQDGDKFRVSIASAPVPKTDEANSKLALLSLLMEQLGGRVEWTSVDEGDALALSIPRSIPAEPAGHS